MRNVFGVGDFASIGRLFFQVENFLLNAEQLLGEYQWKRYDLLVLPPSFP